MEICKITDFQSISDGSCAGVILKKGEMTDTPCENGGISVGLLLIILSITMIILSTVDFHTGLVWAAPPRVNAEIRYVVTLLSISIAFIYIYCQHVQLRARIDGLYMYYKGN